MSDVEHNICKQSPCEDHFSSHRNSLDPAFMVLFWDKQIQLLLGHAEAQKD